MVCVANKDKRLSRTGILGIYTRTCTDFEKIPLTKHASHAILFCFSTCFSKTYNETEKILKQEFATLTNTKHRKKNKFDYVKLTCYCISFVINGSYLILSPYLSNG